MVQFRRRFCIRSCRFGVVLVEILGSPSVNGDSRRDGCRVHRIWNPRSSWRGVRDEDSWRNDYSQRRMDRDRGVSLPRVRMPPARREWFGLTTKPQLKVEPSELFYNSRPNRYFRDVIMRVAA